MGEIFEQKPVKLVTSVIFRDKKFLEEAERGLEELFGPQDDLSLECPFDFTEYYRDEFGVSLSRKLMCFKRLLGKERVPEAKIETNELENRSAVDGRRRVNIDPGYVTEAKLVLLTTKDYTHRVYIGRKIFAESTLFFQDGTFRSWPWTYPDYASEEMVDYYNSVRGKYMEDIGS
ncbi:MAG: DUF4416 family protein [Candidatus Tantalella remota]|nr:DUF4416 family protein [Candidatus Tantalella remota]